MATLDNVSIDIAVVLGKTSTPIHQVLRVGRGAIIELEVKELLRARPNWPNLILVTGPADIRSENGVATLAHVAVIHA